MPAKPTKTGKPGRPSTFDPAIAARICAQLTQGSSLREACNWPDMPSEGTVRGWVLDDTEGFASQYARARSIGLDVLAEDTIRIADECRLGIIEKIDGDGKTSIEKRDMVDRARLQIDTRKWLVSKLRPERYGDTTRLEHTGAAGAPLSVEVVFRKPEPQQPAQLPSRPQITDADSD